MIYIHQPNFMPWIGMIDAMFKCNSYVILDNVQYEMGGWQNRNKILSPNGPIYITIPVMYNSYKPINEMKISNSVININKTIKCITANYKKADHFYISEELFLILNKNHDYLIDLNIEILYWIKKLFKLNLHFVNFSSLNINECSKKERIFLIMQQMNENVLYCGRGAKTYLNSEDFTQRQLNVVWQSDNFHPIYKQRFNKNNFTPNLSFIDMLFNVGVENFIYKMKHDSRN